MARDKPYTEVHKKGQSHLGIVHPTISKHKNGRAFSSHSGSSGAGANRSERAAASEQLLAAKEGEKDRKVSPEELEQLRVNRQFNDCRTQSNKSAQGNQTMSATGLHQTKAADT